MWLESDQHTTGLELPPSLSMVPFSFWKKAHQRLFRLTLKNITCETHYSKSNIAGRLSLRLEVLKVLVEAEFAPRRVLKSYLNEAADRGTGSNLPHVFWEAVHRIIQGKEVVRLWEEDCILSAPYPACTGDSIGRLWRFFRERHGLRLD